MKISVVTDAWHPQVNGVVRTWTAVGREAERLGHAVDFVTPEDFWTIPCPTYPDIRLALNCGRKVAAKIEEFAPDAVHIATEGPLGWAARRHCLKAGYPFTTSFHTKFPEYIALRFRIPIKWSYGWVRRFHDPSRAVLVATETVQAELKHWGFNNIAPWSRGVDTQLFRPRPDVSLDLPRPILLYVGRVAVEKNIGDFLRLDVPGTKLVVGDGPQRQDLAAEFPDAVFVGMKHGVDLAQYYAGADVFVFPSKTDTYGLVMLEALAAGVPVAAYPVPGPLDVVNGHAVGCLDESLERAVTVALTISSESCRAFACDHSWHRTTQQFLDKLVPIAGRG